MPVYVMRYPPRPRRAAERPGRDELLNMGMTPAQVDHEMVRRHEFEVLEENFTHWVMAFGIVICMLLPVSLGLFLFLAYSYCAERDQECDVPLHAWFVVALVDIIYQFNLNGKSVHREVVRYICRYETPGQLGETPPARVRMYHLLVQVFSFGWHCVGLFWVSASDTCHLTAPNLHLSVRLFAAFNIFFVIFRAVSTFGLSHMLASLLRHGLLPAAMLHQNRVAPEGTLELQETVPYDPDAFGESVQCPMCLEDFSKDQTIKKTVCGHYFHEDCLERWLRVNRTCPLCRADLAIGLQTTAAGEEADTIGNATVEDGGTTEDAPTTLQVTTICIADPSSAQSANAGASAEASTFHPDRASAMAASRSSGPAGEAMSAPVVAGGTVPAAQSAEIV